MIVDSNRPVSIGMPFRHPYKNVEGALDRLPEKNTQDRKNSVEEKK